ncbi:MAG: sigma-54 dependent transcriptional regulator [Spirochaetia bacterium]|jgi:DNA-binding NtrC family response regulator
MESFLIVDNDDALTKRLSHYFGAQGFYIEEAPNYTQAIERLSQHVFDVIITDVLSEDLPLEDLLVAIRENKISPVIIVMCGRDGIDDAIRAIRMGATDFIQKPINLAELEIKVDKGTELKRLDHEGQVLRGERNLIYSTKNFIGKSPAIISVLNLVEKVARTNSSVILIGETGTGKELLAGAIHYSSPRAKSAFVRVNCATLPDPLFESELFGHDRGAFTGAEKLRIGRFEQGNGGTVFLDEITDVSLATQAKLLRVLQEREFERLGSNRTIRVDVRIISATNRDLTREIAEGRFREDLYYRLNVVSIKIPPLREREGDIELLADFFLHKYSLEMGKKVTRIEPAAMRLLKSHNWPGNIRELENAIERALIMADSNTITTADLSLPFNKDTAGDRSVVRIPPGGIKWDEVEKELILQALTMSGWVQKGAASLLGLSTRVLNYKIKQFGITNQSWIQNK